VEVQTVDVETPTEVEELEVLEPKEHLIVNEYPQTLTRRSWLTIGAITLANLLVLLASLWILRESKTSIKTTIQESEPTRVQNHIQTQTCWLSNAKDNMLQQSPIRISSFKNHPLDPLSSKEIATTIRVLDSYRKAKVMDIDIVEKAGSSACGNTGPMTTFSKVMYSTINVLEPPKQFMSKWKFGDRLPPREAHVVYHVNRHNSSHSYEVYVDITKQTVIEIKNITDYAQPSITSIEIQGINHILMLDPRWIDSMARRGYYEENASTQLLASHDVHSSSLGTFVRKSLSDVICVPRGVGQSNVTSRLLAVECYDATSKNYWTKPIEGLSAVIDLAQINVKDVIDTGVVPLREEPHIPAPNARKLNGIFVMQPKGQSFTITGNMVSWDRWQFHLRPELRSGYIISQVTFNQRNLLYQVYLAETFTSTIDIDGKILKETMDLGEFGLGLFMNKLTVDIDCPKNSFLMDAHISSSEGTIQTITGGICIFEKYAGDVAWSHLNVKSGSFNNRKKTITLVVRSVYSVRNFDYIVDTEFSQSGEISFKVGVTGILPLKTVADGMNLLAKNTAGLQTEHFFTYYIDIDIDGAENNFVTESYQLINSQWHTSRQVVTSEVAAQKIFNPSNPETWVFTKSSDEQNINGYQLEPKSSVLTTRNSTQTFTRNHLWVTPFDHTQRYPAGEYPNQSNVSSGLPTWITSDRSIQNKDIVAWYTMGVRHIPRKEDYPVISTLSTEFVLRPYNFFEQNVALTVTSDAEESFMASTCIKQ
jgi:primary-amine oxidase